MAKEKRYYWLKLQNDFFKQHEIRVVESMPNGKDYILFYLKMLVESVSHDGMLRFSDTIPYNVEMLSAITNTNIDIVRSAMKIFIGLNLIEVFDDETIYMLEVQKMIGSEGESAERVRRHREAKKALQCNSEALQGSLDIREQILDTREKKLNNNNNINKNLCPFDPAKTGSNEAVLGQNDPTFDPNDLGQNRSNGSRRGQKQGQIKYFTEFWSAYPRKVKKQTALKAWNRLRIDEEAFAELMSGLEAWKACKQWNKDGGDYIPYPATFLNSMQWQEVPEPIEPDEYAGFDAETRERLIATEKRLRSEGAI